MYCSTFPLCSSSHFLRRTLMKYIYGMKERPFSIGCQPSHDFYERIDDDSGKYWDLLIYEALLSADEMHNYELEFIGEYREE